MKTIRKISIFMIITMLLTIVVPSRALAAGYKDMPKKVGVAVDKVWDIGFNEELDINTIKNIVVVDENNKEVNIKVELKNKKTVAVFPLGEYEQGKNYTLLVKDSVKSSNGEQIKNPVRMEFTTETKVIKPTAPKSYIVALDAGRAGNDNGAEVGPTGVKGKDINLDVALKAGKILEQNGVQVVYTRTGDKVSWSKEESISARSKIVNDAKANLLVSIHCNSYSSSSASGSETYYLKGNGESKKLASYVQSELSAKTSLPNRGIVESELKTLSTANATGVYVALGFITNPTEEKVLNSKEFKDNSAQAIANAVLKYLDVKTQVYIKDIKDISVLLYKGEKYSLPTTVNAVMSDNMDSKVKVKWDKSSVDTSKQGTFYYKGTVAGYDKKVNLKVTVISEDTFGDGFKKVFIDPASAGNIIDTSVPTAIKEKNINLAIALKLGKLLEDKGIEVSYSRKGDTVPWTKEKDIQERVKLANASGAELLVRIHMNSYSNPASKGIETYYSADDTVGKSLADSIQSSIIDSTKGVNRGVKTKQFEILEGFKGTGVVVYPGFITNAEEEKLLSSADYQNKIVKAIGDSIINAYNDSNKSIKSVNDINVRVKQGEKYSLPTKVPALNSEDKTVQQEVIWETNKVDTSNPGTMIIKGRVKNYDKQITLYLVVYSKNLTKYKVAIDPGHGGYDSGAVGTKGTKEKDITLAVSLMVGDILVKNGIDVVFTRTSDNVPWPSNKNAELQARCDIANEAKVDYFVSIHANSVDGSPTTSGIETFYDRGTTEGIPLAQNIQNELIGEFKAKDRGIKPSGLYVVKYTDAPAVLVELEFLSNPEKEEILKNSEYQKRYAQAIANGIMKTMD